MSQVKRPDPLYSPLGCGATLLLVLLLGTTLYFRGGILFSPGALSTAAPRGVMLGGVASHAELAASCFACHAPWQGAAPTRCEQCHSDIVAQRQAGYGLHGRLPATQRCRACHTEHQGAEANINLMPLAAFDHAQLTAFTLVRHSHDYDGAAIDCLDCHRDKQFVAGLVNCSDCHRAAAPLFLAEHSALFGADCVACHDGRDRMANFDHQAHFALSGAHTTVACGDCHRQQQFSGTPRTCAGCHQEPALHAGQFGLDCARCHTSSAWTPARLQQHTFPLDHGGGGQIACQTCHESRYTVYTCYNCHEHDPADVQKEHEKKEIFDLAECAACHPTGREDEAKVKEKSRP